MGRLGLACVVAALAAPVPGALAQVLVRQGATEHAVDPIAGSDSVVDFYQYGQVKNASAFTGYEQSQTSLLFLYEQTSVSPAALSLVVVHDLYDDGSGGNVQFDLAGLPGAAFYAVRDDPGGDTYAPDPPAFGQTTANWNWAPCCTDGAALSGLEATPFCIRVTPDFQNGIDTWYALSGSGPLQRDLPSLSQPTYLCKDCLELSCPSSVTAECSGSGEAAVAVVASGTSLCGGASIQNDRSAGGADASGQYPLGITTVIFTITDGPGFSKTCESQVIVEDTTPPLLVTCPAPLVLECENGQPVPSSDARVQAWLATFEASDACGPPQYTNDAPASFPLSCSGPPVPVTFVAEDPGGNTVSCVSSVTVVDTTPPAVTLCPAPLALECSEAGGVPASDGTVQAWLQSFAAGDVCSTVSLSHDAPAFFPSGCGTGVATTVTFEARDGCGNPVTCVSMVTVVDTTPPVVTLCPAPLALECNEAGGVSASDGRVQTWLQSFAASDVCSTVSLSNDAPGFFPSGCGTGFATAVTFAARDTCGNPVTCVSTVTVVDTTPPVVTLCPAPLALECSEAGGVPASDGTVQAWLQSFAAGDVCSTVSLSNNAPGFFPSGCGTGFATAVTFEARDTCGNPATCVSSVTIADTTPPELVVPAPIVLECSAPGGVPASDPEVVAWIGSATASDICDGAVQSNDAPVLFPSGCAPGVTTTVTFEAVDNCANAAAEPSTVTVLDTTPPVVSGCEFIVLELTPSLAPLRPQPASSACSGASSALVQVACGQASDICDATLVFEARVVVLHHEVEPAGCVRVEEEIAVACDEVLEIVRLAPPCPAKLPRSPRPPRPALSVRSDGTRVLFGEELRLEVRSRDTCGNVSAACSDDPTRQGGATPCAPSAPKCPVSACGG